MPLQPQLQKDTAMDDVIYDALVDLKASIDKQAEVQEQLLATMKALIGTLQEVATENADLADVVRAVAAGEKPRERVFP